MTVRFISYKLYKLKKRSNQENEMYGACNTHVNDIYRNVKRKI